MPLGGFDALSKLPDFSWRDKKYPIVGHSWGQRWDTVEHTASFGKVQFIETLAPINWHFDYVIAMRQTIAMKQYHPNLFSQLIDLKLDCDKRTPGDVMDPIWGIWPCVCVSFEGDTDLNRRDGVDVKASFRYSPDIDDIIDFSADGVSSVQQLWSDAGALDDEIARAFYEREQKKPDAASDLLSAIAGFGRQLERAGDRVSQSLNKFAYQCEKIEGTVAALQDPKTFGLRRAVRRNRAAALKLIRRINSPVRETVSTTLRFGKAITQLAAESKMTVPQLLMLNPALAKTPIVPPGTKVVRYASK